MSKGLGQNIVIKFTQDLVGEVSGLNPKATWGWTTPTGTVSHSARYSSSYDSTNAFDENTSSYWRTSSAAPQWIKIKLDTPTVIRGFRWYVYNYKPNDFILEGSNDDILWFPIIKSISDNDTVGWKEFSFEPVQYQYYRWTALTYHFSSNLYIYEIQINMGLNAGTSNTSAFKITGHEYQHVNGKLIDKIYSVKSVEKHPDHAENTIRLVMHPQSRFNNVEGEITVQYDMSKGNLQGKGGFIESFSREFMPTDLVPLPNPYIAERLTATPDVLVIFIKVDFRHSYEEEKITVIPNASITFTYTGIINP